MNVKTNVNIGMRITNIGLVIGINNTITIYINKDNITRSNRTVNSVTILSIESINLSLILEYAISLITIEITNRLSYFSTENFTSSTVQHSRRTVDNTLGIGDTCNLILVISDVKGCTVSKIFTYAVIPVNTEFKTFILHVTTINIRGTQTPYCLNRGPYKPILGLLDIVVEVQPQPTIQESGIDTKVYLLGGFPCHVLILQHTHISTCRLQGFVAIAEIVSILIVKCES